MTLEAGTFVPMQVAREVSPYGYFLSDGTQDVLLHYSEAAGEVRVGETLRVFLFHDTEDRLSATMRTPLIELGKLALLVIVDMHPRLGCFLEMGLGRNLLLPVRELPELESLRPIVGEKVYVVMAHDKSGRLIAKLAGEQELEPLSVRAPDSWKNRWVEARVYNPLRMGSFVLCDAGLLGFGVIGMIHETERTRMLRLGESVQARVTFVREDGRVNLSMKPRKEVGREDDSEKLLEFLRTCPDGVMPYSDKTSADIIAQRFQMSKSAFKRAIGKLMRENIVYQEGGMTYLKKQE